MSKEPTRGRPPLPKGTAATSQIQIRVQTQRKAAYVRAAKKKGQSLAEWCFDHLDAASGHEDHEGKGNAGKQSTAAPSRERLLRLLFGREYTHETLDTIRSLAAAELNGPNVLRQARAAQGVDDTTG